MARFPALFLAACLWAIPAVAQISNPTVLDATITPQGRLTLTSATPVLTATVSGATTVYYTPYVGNIVPIYDGVRFVPTQCAEISNVTTASSVGSAGPFAVADNAVYDLYAWNNSGTCTLTRSDYWQQVATVTNTNASPAVFTHNSHGLLAGAPVRLVCIGGGSLSPGFTANTTYYVVSPATNTYDLAATPGGAAINAGGASTCVTSQQATEGIGQAASTTNAITRGTANAQTRTNGILLNTSAFANGPGALRGTYVGSIASNSSGTIDYTFGAAASGGTAAVLNVWNAYNRVATTTKVTDSGTTYTYTTATIRQARASATDQITFLIGLNEETVRASYFAAFQAVAVAGATVSAGLGLDSTTAFTGQRMTMTNAAAAGNVDARGVYTDLQPGLGVHVLSANETGDGTNANTFNVNSTNVLGATVRN